MHSEFVGFVKVRGKKKVSLLTRNTKQKTKQVIYVGNSFPQLYIHVNISIKANAQLLTLGN